MKDINTLIRNGFEAWLYDLSKKSNSCFYLKKIVNIYIYIPLQKLFVNNKSDIFIDSSPDSWHAEGVFFVVVRMGV